MISTITQQQARERWDTLPEVLREALFSEQNADAVIRVAKAEHLAPEKIAAVATLVGDVLLGFVEREDLPRELRSALNLNPQIADMLAKEIDRKVFTPIRTEIDQNYRPVENISGTHLDLRKSVTSTSSVSESKPSGFSLAKPVVPSGMSEVPQSAWPEEKPSIAPPVSPQLQPSEAEEPAPFMIHREGGGIAPMADSKRSLGGLFHGAGRGVAGGDSSHVAAKIDLGKAADERGLGRGYTQMGKSSVLPVPPRSAKELRGVQISGVTPQSQKGVWRRLVEWLFGRSETQLARRAAKVAKNHGGGMLPLVSTQSRKPTIQPHGKEGGDEIDRVLSKLSAPHMGSGKRIEEREKSEVPSLAVPKVPLTIPQKTPSTDSTGLPRVGSGQPRVVHYTDQKTSASQIPPVKSEKRTEERDTRGAHSIVASQQPIGVKPAPAVMRSPIAMYPVAKLKKGLWSRFMDWLLGRSKKHGKLEEIEIPLPHNHADVRGKERGFTRNDSEKILKPPVMPKPMPPQPRSEPPVKPGGWSEKPPIGSLPSMEAPRPRIQVQEITKAQTPRINADNHADLRGKDSAKLQPPAPAHKPGEVMIDLRTMKKSTNS